MKHKIILFLLFLLSSCALQAQLVHAKRMFSETWYVDGQPKSRPEIRLHLDKANPEAAKHYRGAQRAELWSLVFSTIGVVGAGWILGAASNADADTTGGWALMLFGLSGSAISSSVSSSKFDRAVEVYNLSLTPPPPTRK